MNMTHMLTVALVGTALALAGCMSADGSLDYSGKENGTHSQTFECDDSGTIKGSGSVFDGSVRITLTDSAGQQLFQQTFKGEFTLDEKQVNGASGEWKVQAQRVADDLVRTDFNGKYSFSVNC